MRNVKKFIGVFILMVGMMMFSSNQVKAEMTYDLNGNQTDVSVWTKSTSLKDGSYKITSSETGTIAYFDKNGKLLKLENKSTGEIIINNEETTTVKIKVPETTKAPDKVTMPKVKKLKKKTKYSYYKGVKSVKKNGKAKWGKIKYKYGITLSWQKVKNAKGYEIYRYENAKECWTKIKTTKKTSYTLTNMLEGENVKIRVRSYKKTSSGNEYGTYSGILKFKTKQMYTKIYKNAKTKSFISKFGSEDAFVYQNKYRQKSSSEQLIWNDALYTIAVQRTKDKDSKPHEKLDSTTENILLTKYGTSKEEQKEKHINIAENMVFGGEASILNPADSWYRTQFYEEGFSHYHNMVAKSHKVGAIAILWRGNSGITISGVYDSDQEFWSYIN